MSNCRGVSGAVSAVGNASVFRRRYILEIKVCVSIDIALSHLKHCVISTAPTISRMISANVFIFDVINSCNYVAAAVKDYNLLQPIIYLFKMSENKTNFES